MIFIYSLFKLNINLNSVFGAFDHFHPKISNELKYVIEQCDKRNNFFPKYCVIDNKKEKKQKKCEQCLKDITDNKLKIS